MAIEYRINKLLGEHFNMFLLKVFPRHSIRFAKKHFNNKPIKVIEIGTYEGYNARSILKELNIFKFYIVDPYKEYEDYLDLEPHQNQKRLNKVFNYAKKLLEKYKYIIQWVKKLSDDAIDMFEDNSIDFIYIDGNHKYEYVKRDIENYWKKVKQGGILAGHDITIAKDNYGVARAVEEFCRENNLFFYPSRTDWWIIKK